MGTPGLGSVVGGRKPGKDRGLGGVQAGGPMGTTPARLKCPPPPSEEEGRGPQEAPCPFLRPPGWEEAPRKLSFVSLAPATDATSESRSGQGRGARLRIEVAGWGHFFNTPACHLTGPHHGLEVGSQDSLICLPRGSTSSFYLNSWLRCAPCHSRAGRAGGGAPGARRWEPRPRRAQLTLLRASWGGREVSPTPQTPLLRG